MEIILLPCLVASLSVGGCVLHRLVFLLLNLPLHPKSGPGLKLLSIRGSELRLSDGVNLVLHIDQGWRSRGSLLPACGGWGTFPERRNHIWFLFQWVLHLDSLLPSLSQG